MIISKILLSVILFLGGIFSGSQLKEHRVKSIRKPLKLTTTKATPPRLAFIQTLNFEQARVASTESAAPHLSVNLNEIIQKRQLRPLAFVLDRRQVNLPAILVTRAEIYSRKPSPKIPSPALQDLYHEPVRQDSAWPETLTEREKSWLHQANVTEDDFKVFNEPVVDPVAVHVQKTIQQEMGKAPANAFPGWIISKPSASNPAPFARSPAEESEPKGFVKTSGHTVEGLIRLGMGVILGAQEHMEVHWSREGTNKIPGKVLMEGNVRYQIQVPELAGSVHVEIFDAYRQVKARGTLRLSEHRQGSDIVLHSQRTIASQYTNFYDSPSKIMDYVRFKKPKGSKGPEIKAMVSVDADAHFVADDGQRLLVDGVAAGSSAFGFTEAKGYYPSIHWVTTGALRPFPLVPESTVKALLDLARSATHDSRGSARNESLVLGQVIKDGKPVSGVQVILQDGSGRKPIYLNALLIPDTSLKESSPNGFFVFADLEKGYHSFKAERGAFFFGFGNVLAEEGAISFVEIEEAGQMAPYDIRAFDAFSGQELSAEVDLQGLSHPVELDGFATIQHPITNYVELVQARPKSPDYVDSLYVAKGEDDHIHLPMVRKQWLEQISATLNLSQQPGQGLLIGFVSKGNYQVSFPHLNKEVPATVIFFDSAGNRVEAPVENGGFIAFNVPASAHTVVVRDNFGETASQVAPVDPDRITTLKFHF